MTFSYVAGPFVADEGEAWKTPEPDVWALCDQCGVEFNGPGSDSEREATIRALLAGWFEWTPPPSESLDRAFGKQCLCPRCKTEFE